MSVTANAYLGGTFFLGELEGGQYIGQVSAEESVDLWAPSASIDAPETETSQSSYVYKYGGLVAGVRSALSEDAPGITFALNISVPSIFTDNDQHPGKADSVQLVNWNATPNENLEDTNGAFWLDNIYPYGDNVAVAPNSAVANQAGYDIQCKHTDTPADGWSPVFTSFSVQNSFKDYFMYQPPSSDSIMVPLWETDWTWNAAGSGSLTTMTPDPPGQTAITSSAYATGWPAWTSVLSNTGE